MMGARAKKKDERQPDLFRAHHTFTILLNALVLDGTLARIQKECSASLSVFVILKTHCDLDSGLVSMGTTLLAKEASCCRESVSKAISVLEQEKLLEKIAAEPGKRPIYRLIDQVECLPNIEGLKPKRMAIPFVPTKMSERVQDIVAFKKTGLVPDRALKVGVHIENLNIKFEFHQHNHIHGDVTNVIHEKQTDLEKIKDIEDPKLREFALEKVTEELENLRSQLGRRF